MDRLLVLACVVVLGAAAPTYESQSLCSVGEQMNIQLGATRPKGISYTCAECERITSTLQDYCLSHNHQSTPTHSEFVSICSEIEKPISDDFETVEDKCSGFLDFAKEVYCPLDPCVQITNERNFAQNALCNLLKCTTPRPVAGGLGAPAEPLVCPVYVKRIMEACEDQPSSKKSIAHSHACGIYPSNYTKEGCVLVRDLMHDLVAPADLCAIYNCENSITDYNKFCVESLKLPIDEPVPVPGYVSWLSGAPPTTDCDELKLAKVGLQIISASFGKNCSETVNTTNNNILQSVREDCQGKMRCTVGNRNLVNKTSAFDPLHGNIKQKRCKLDFQVDYRCKEGGPIHHFVAPEEAKYQARPFDCLKDLTQKQYMRYMKMENTLWSS